MTLIVEHVKSKFCPLDEKQTEHAPICSCFEHTMLFSADPNQNPIQGIPNNDRIYCVRFGGGKWSSDFGLFGGWSSDDGGDPSVWESSD